jgi:hypothetical protein
MHNILPDSKALSSFMLRLSTSYRVLQFCFVIGTSLADVIALDFSEDILIEKCSVELFKRCKPSSSNLYKHVVTLSLSFHLFHESSSCVLPAG